MSELATLEVAGRTATLTMRRPDARNALSIDLLGAMHERLDDLAGRTDITVLVLAGEGKAFCAGMDLKAVLGEPDAVSRLLHALARFALRLRGLEAVVVARVQGAAIGGGCGLACACDFAATHADARLGFPEVTLGVCPAVVAPWVVRRVGAGRARAILLRGGVMSGSDAHALGLVTDLAPSLEALDGAAADLVSRLASGGPGAMRATKGLLNELDGSLDAGLAGRCADLSASVLATPEAREALRAAMERR
jgi:methylglutaconyl-CoA hydratase